MLIFRGEILEWTLNVPFLVVGFFSSKFCVESPFFFFFFFFFLLFYYYYKNMHLFIFKLAPHLILVTLSGTFPCRKPVTRGLGY